MSDTPPSLSVQADNVAAGIVYGDQHIYGGAPSPRLIQPSRLDVPSIHLQRSNLVDEIVRRLAAGQKAQISAVQTAGEGGYGKTVLAHLVAEKCADLFPRPVVLNCSGRRPLDLFGGLVKGDLAEGKSAEALALLARSDLCDPKTLLILDNVDDPDHWREFEESGLLPTCALLTTCRHPIPKLDPVKVDQLQFEETRELLGFYVDSAHQSENEAAIRTIHKETEGLILLVVILGVLMKRGLWSSWRDVADWVRDTPPSTYPKDFELERAGYPRSTAAILDYAYERLDHAEQRVLQFAAILPADRIHPEWLVRLLEIESERAGAAMSFGTTELGAERTALGVVRELQSREFLRPTTDEYLGLHRLHRRHLKAIRRTEKDPFVAIHQLIEERGQAAHETLNLPFAALQAFTDVLDLSICLRDGLVRQGQWSFAYQNDLAGAFMNRGNVRQDVSDYSGALSDYGDAISIMVSLRDELLPQGQWSFEYRNSLAGAFMNRGNARQGVSDYSGAISDYGEAISIRGSLRDELVPQGQWSFAYRNDLAKAFVNRGNARQGVSDYSGAISDYGEAISIRVSLRDELLPQGQWSFAYRNDLAGAFVNRGVARSNSSNYLGAISDYGEAISIREEPMRRFPEHFGLDEVKSLLGVLLASQAAGNPVEDTLAAIQEAAQLTYAARCQHGMPVDDLLGLLEAFELRHLVNE